jgi:hypothetical protein
MKEPTYSPDQEITPVNSQTLERGFLHRKAAYFYNFSYVEAPGLQAEGSVVIYKYPPPTNNLRKY